VGRVTKIILLINYCTQIVCPESKHCIVFKNELYTQKALFIS